jgi:hypothetical protein
MTNSKTLRMIDMTINAYKNKYISLLEALEIITVYLGLSLNINNN